LGESPAFGDPAAIVDFTPRAGWAAFEFVEEGPQLDFGPPGAERTIDQTGSTSFPPRECATRGQQLVGAAAQQPPQPRPAAEAGETLREAQ
jgi:hypothetical protein